MPKIVYLSRAQKREITKKYKELGSIESVHYSLGHSREVISAHLHASGKILKRSPRMSEVQKKIDKKRRELKPAHVTASAETQIELWALYQNEAMVTAMRAAHPEMEIPGWKGAHQ